MGWEPNSKHVEYLDEMSESYKSCGYRVIINTRVGVGSHNSITEVTGGVNSLQDSKLLSFQFVETMDDGERDWGAHVKGDEIALDKVRAEAVYLAFS